MKRVLMAAAAVWLSTAVGYCADKWDRVSSMTPRSEVRVKTFDGIERKGVLVSTAGDSIRLMGDNGETMTARADVARVELYDSSRKWKRALIGAGIGAAVGIVAGFATCPSCVGEQSSSDFNQRLVGGGAIGAGVGAGVGAIGSSYKTVYKGRR